MMSCCCTFVSNSYFLLFLLFSRAVDFCSVERMAKTAKVAKVVDDKKEKLSFGDKVVIKLFKGVNKVVAWHRLPRYLGVVNLLAFRKELDHDNLYDVYPDASAQGTTATCPMKDERYLTARNSDGLYNSLEQPVMGCSGMRFGRNVPRDKTRKPINDEELMDPSPRLVSEQLLARTKFKPATIVNLLAAAVSLPRKLSPSVTANSKRVAKPYRKGTCNANASQWIQFQVHDWFMHDVVNPSIKLGLFQNLTSIERTWDK